jgi:general stress protein YciG
MANEQNLVPLSTEKAREIGKKGGIASGKAKRQRKTLAQIGEMIGGLDIKSQKNRAILREAGIEDEDMINDVGMMFRLNLKAQTGDPKAIELLSKLRGQFKEISQTEILAPKPLVDLTERKKNGE